MNFDQKAIIVTGGGSGLGEAIARIASAEGYPVILDLNEEKGKRSQELNGLFYKTNVVKEEDVQTAINGAVERFGTIWCSELCRYWYFDTCRREKGRASIEEFNFVVQVNLVGRLMYSISRSCHGDK